MKFNFFSRDTILRTILFGELKKLKLEGDTLDLGGGKVTRYNMFIKKYNNSIESVNIDKKRNPTYTYDLNSEKLSFEKKYDNIISFHTIEHIYNFENILKIGFTNLKIGGKLVLEAPFIYKVHADPYDFSRLTSTYYKEKLKDLGFSNVHVIPRGFGVFTASYSMLEPLLRRNILYPLHFFLRFLFISTDILLCKVSKSYKKYFGPNAYPLGYKVVAKK